MADRCSLKVPGRLGAIVPARTVLAVGEGSIQMRSARALLTALLALVPLSALAQETLKVAVGQRGNWDSAASELGQRAGIFRKHGLKLEILYTQGTGETQQAVISGGVDVGVGLGTIGVIAAYAKGAPIRAIGSATTGSSDQFWYVLATSPIRTMADAAERTIAYSTNGSSTNIIVLGLLDRFHVRAKPVATGGIPATYTAVLSRQVDIGYSSVPFGLDAVGDGRIRIIARGSDVPGSDQKTVRLLVANLAALTQRKGAIASFVQAYRETIDWMYESADALTFFSEMAEIAGPTAKRVRDEFYSKSMLDPDRIVGLDAVMGDAVNFRYIAHPLTRRQLDELFQVPPRASKP